MREPLLSEYKAAFDSTNRPELLPNSGVLRSSHVMIEKQDVVVAQSLTCEFLCLLKLVIQIADCNVSVTLAGELALKRERAF